MLRISSKSSLYNSTQFSNFVALNGGIFVDGTELHSPNQGRFALRGQGIQGKQVNGSSLPMYFLFNSVTHSCLNRTHYQIPFVLPHSSSFPHFQKILPLVESSSYYWISFRNFCNYGFEVGSDGENESTFVVVDNVELERVCKVIDETFAIDRNMEAVLDQCGVNLSHELVLSVLQRFKHARKVAFRFFCWAGERPGFGHDSRTYNAMVDILGKCRQFETLMSVVEEMGVKGLLSSETFTICIKVFAAAKERKKAIGVFDLMKKYKIKISVETINCLLDALGRAKLGKEAQVLFERLEHTFTPNLKTYTVLINGWCRVGNLMEAGKIWNCMIDRGFKPDLVAHNIMLEGLLKGKKGSDAIKLFGAMKAKGPLPNVRSYTILIKDLCKHGNMKEAVNYLDDMINSGCEPDAAVYTCLMMGFGNQKKMDIVYRLLEEMKEKGCPPDGRTYNALIKMMVNRRMPDSAVKIYKKMISSSIEPSTHTYNMIMKSYFVARNYEMGCAVWEEMKRKGCCPDENTYTVFIGGLIRLGRWNEACKYLEEMIDKGMKAPQLDLHRAGGCNIWEDFAQKMKCSRNSEVADLFGRWRR